MYDRPKQQQQREHPYRKSSYKNKTGLNRLVITSTNNAALQFYLGVDFV